MLYKEFYIKEFYIFHFSVKMVSLNSESWIAWNTASSQKTGLSSWYFEFLQSDHVVIIRQRGTDSS